MITSLSRSAQRALLWARKQLAPLVGRRRTQLMVAVLFGAVIGGGFVAIASTGLGDADHGSRPGMSVMDRSDHGPMGDSGYDNHDR